MIGLFCRFGARRPRRENERKQQTGGYFQEREAHH
jgi:hypothetical protein